METTKRVLRWETGSHPAWKVEELASEEPLEFQVEGRSVCVTMRTPGHDDELAAGFLLTEGLIKSPREILRLAPYPRNQQGNVLNIFLQPQARIDFARLTRHVFVSSSCGLCGKATIASAHQHFKPVTGEVMVGAHTLLSLPPALSEGQQTFGRTGGLHAAAVFNLKGKLVVLREDVGRHNAVDKALGYALLNQLLPMDHHVLMVSGRASFEIMQKALAARIPVVAAISAPSSLAVEFARRSRQTLIGFLRGQRMNIYSLPHRIRFDSPAQKRQPTLMFLRNRQEPYEQC
jgi:FdhD protein